MHSPSAFGGAPQVAKTVFSDIRGNISSLLASAINQNALDQALTTNDKTNVLSMLRNYGDLDSGIILIRDHQGLGFLVKKMLVVEIEIPK